MLLKTLFKAILIGCISCMSLSLHTLSKMKSKMKWNIVKDQYNRIMIDSIVDAKHNIYSDPCCAIKELNNFYRVYFNGPQLHHNDLTSKEIVYYRKQKNEAYKLMKKLHAIRI